jgi:hypothetical protein|eukprot:SAG25_NODE_2762_length_1397_cov_5.929813_2_plen_137_part_00
MPALAVALPSLQLADYGFCMHTFARRVALYFVVPLGLATSAVGHSKHGNVAVTSSSLLGMLLVAATATVKRLSPRGPRRNLLNAFGCALMLGATFRARHLERSTHRGAQPRAESSAQSSAQCCAQQCCEACPARDR